MKRPSTVGAHVVPARFGELARALSALSGDDLDQLNTGIGRWMRWPLGHLLTAVVLPLGGSVFVCLYNLEPAGVSLIRRFNNTARVMALAVAPDLRRNGIARTLLEDAAVRAAARDIRWLWMTIPSVNIAATRCALRCGFRRYRPQFLRCEIKPLIQAPAYDVMLYEVHDQQAEQAIAQWLEVEVDAGDAWIKDLLMGELLPLILPSQGRVWRCSLYGREVGCAHLSGPAQHPTVTLWLEPESWNTTEEMAVLKAILDTQIELPSKVDVVLGSEGHLRASVARYKTIHFKPALAERVIFARAIETQRRAR